MKRIVYFIALVILFASCEEKTKRNSLEEIGKTQSQMLQAFQKVDSLRHEGIVEENIMNDFIDQAHAFYELYPEEKVAPEMLVNAGVASMTLAKYYKETQPDDIASKAKYARQALSTFDIIVKVYPDYSGVKKSYLNKALIYDDILEDYSSAELEYREFIHKYPHDSISYNLSNYLQYLGKTPEEIMAEFSTKK